MAQTRRSEGRDFDLGPEQSIVYTASTLYRRRLLVSTAADLFSRRDFDSVSISQVAAKAGLPRGSVTNYFPTKRAIAVAVIEEMNSRWRAAYLKFDASNLRPLDSLFAEMILVLNQSLTDPVTRAGYRLTQYSGINLQFDSHFQLADERVAAYLMAAIRDGDVRPDINVESVSRILCATIAGIGQISDRHPNQASVSDRVNEVRAALWPYMKP